MRLVFAGTPAFAAAALGAVLDAGHEVACVLCQPDRPAGRGLRLQPGAVKALALAHQLPVRQPLSLKDPAEQAALAALAVDCWVVAAYGLILPPAVLAQPPLGCLNIHASLLPRWRGAAPIQRALLAGDAETGVCIMQMEAGLDTGPVLRRGRLPVDPHDTTGSLHDRLAVLGAQLIVASLQQLPAELAAAQPQAADGVLYAAKLDKREAWLDWQLPAVLLERRVRAFDPSPGARFRWRDEAIRASGACCLSAPVAQPPGTVLAAGAQLQVATGDGVLQLERLQRPGGRWLPVREFLQGCPIPVGAQLAGAALD